MQGHCLIILINWPGGGQGPAPTRVWVPWGTLDFQRPEHRTQSNLGYLWSANCSLFFKIKSWDYSLREERGLGSIPGRSSLPQQPGHPQTQPRLPGHSGYYYSTEKARVTVGFRASLPSMPRLLSLRLCEQAQARLGPASRDRVSLPVIGTGDRR